MSASANEENTGVELSEAPVESGGDEGLRRHYESLCRQAEELQQEFPDFKLSHALTDPDFVRMTSPELGLSLRRAYYALNREKLDAIAQMKGAEAMKEALSKSLSANAARPREQSAGSAARLSPDYGNMSKADRAELKTRIRNASALGKKLYP